ISRVLLIMPHLPQRMGTPYLGQQYVAASLLAAGHEVRCVDMAAMHWQGSDEDIVDLVRDWSPHVVGMTLFTYNALEGYRLVGVLKERGGPGPRPLFVAGGPHATICHDEPVRHGFDVS